MNLSKEPIIIEGVYTEKQITSGLIKQAYHNKIVLFIYIFGAIMLLAGLYTTISANDAYLESSYSVGFGILVLLGMPTVLTRIAIWNYRTNDKFREKYTYSFYDEYFWIQTSSIEKQIFWKNIRSVKLFKDHAMLMENHFVGYSVFFSSFKTKSDLQEFKQMIKPINRFSLLFEKYLSKLSNPHRIAKTVGVLLIAIAILGFLLNISMIILMVHKPDIKIKYEFINMTVTILASTSIFALVFHTGLKLTRLRGKSQQASA